MMRSTNQNEGSYYDLFDVAGISWKKTTALNSKADKEVVGYFDRRTTSGVVESINNKLKLIKKLGYGFRNFVNFRLRCLLS